MVRPGRRPAPGSEACPGSNAAPLLTATTTLARMPATRQAFTEHWISWSQARAVITDALEVGGVVLDEHDVGGSLVLFLKDSGPPWGLRTVSMAAGVMDVDDDERVGDQTSYGLEEHRGEPVSDLF